MTQGPLLCLWEIDINLNDISEKRSYHIAKCDDVLHRIWLSLPLSPGWAVFYLLVFSMNQAINLSKIGRISFDNWQHVKCALKQTFICPTSHALEINKTVNIVSSLLFLAISLTCGSLYLQFMAAGRIWPYLIHIRKFSHIFTNFIFCLRILNFCPIISH